MDAVSIVDAFGEGRMDFSLRHRGTEKYEERFRADLIVEGKVIVERESDLSVSVPL